MNRELIGKAIALLVSYREYTGDCRIANVCGEIIEALKAELAKPEQEPVAWLQFRENLPPLITPRDLGTPVYLAQPEQDNGFDRTGSHMAGKYVDTAQPEPVAWMHVQGYYEEPNLNDLSEDAIARGWEQYPLYTTPPKREWQGLTDDEILSLVAFEPHPSMNRTSIVHAVQAKLREKNT